MQVERRTQEQRTEATRAVLIAAARELFSVHGFAATGTAEIVAAAGVTRGALYHHFEGKEGLFEAVYAEVEGEVTEKVALVALGADDAWSGLIAGIETFLDCCERADVQRIVVVEAPVVLGWDRWRELEDAYGLGLTRAALQAAVDAGVLIADTRVEALAHLVMGALREACLLLSRAEDPAATRDDITSSLHRMLSGFRAG